MNEHHKPTLRIHGPVDLLSAIPYLLGFRPALSLVLIGLTHGVLVVTARIDIKDVIEHGEYLTETVAAMVGGGSTQFVVAIFTDDAHVDEEGKLPHVELAASAHRTIEDAGADVLDMLLVGNGVWFSYLCQDARCCPTKGRLMPQAPTPFAAAATVAGLTVASARGELERRFEPGEGRLKLRQLVDRAERALGPVVVNDQLGLHGRVALRAIIAAVDAADIGTYIELDDVDVARIGAGLRHTAIRDAVWLEVDRRGGGGDDLWLDLARRLPSPYDAAPLFLHGWSAWRQGNGTVAGMAAERALVADPGYAAADLLLSALAHRVDPRALPTLDQRDADTDTSTA